MFRTACQTMTTAVLVVSSAHNTSMLDHKQQRVLRCACLAVVAAADAAVKVAIPVAHFAVPCEYRTKSNIHKQDQQRRRAPALHNTTWPPICILPQCNPGASASTPLILTAAFHLDVCRRSGGERAGRAEDRLRDFALQAARTQQGTKFAGATLWEKETDMAQLGISGVT
eukprot:6195551-Pleurochrysis_carterae.AAC.1